MDIFELRDRIPRPVKHKSMSVGVAPGQEPGTEKQKAQEADEKSADLPTEIVAALSGDEQGKEISLKSE